MRLSDYFEDGNEKKLYDKCIEYYKYKNEYSNKHIEAPPLEMAQKLGLMINEYSEFLIWIDAGGFEDLTAEKLNWEIDRATFIDDKLTNLPY